MHDVIVVGTGASGAAAALEFVDQGIRPLILDVGYNRPKQQPRADGNLYSYRLQHDSFDLMIGERFQGLSNLLNDRSIPVRLTTPNVEYVTQNAQRLSPIDEEDFCVIQGFTKGGLANAWGAGLYRFTDRDLDGFPIRALDLSPFFDKLTREIGISGTDDDLTPFFGSTQDLLPPIRMSHNIKKLYRRYVRKKKHFDGELFIGRSRTGALTQPKDGRPALEYNNLEFWQELPAIYSPTMTINKLIEGDRIGYRERVLVECWTEQTGYVRVQGKNIDTGEELTFEAKKLVLTAGPINTSKIVLKSFNDFRTRLTLLENPAVQFPLVLPTSIGRHLEQDAFGLVQLNLIWESKSFGALLQGSIMEITSPMRAEFFSSLPYSAFANLALIRYILPGMLVMQLFFPASCQEPSHLSLNNDGWLRVEGQQNTIDVKKLKRLLMHFRRLGVWTLSSLLVKVPLGHAVHYAGTIPMKQEPKPYECDRFGKLHGTQNIFIGDSSSFPCLPAKNMSFAMMANAMRIARKVADELRSNA